MKKVVFFLGILLMAATANVYSQSILDRLIDKAVDKAVDTAVTKTAEGINNAQAKSSYKKVVAYSSGELLKLFSAGEGVWINNIATGDEIGTANDIIDDITVILMDKGIITVDRNNADAIAKEQNFQYSGVVNDSDIISFGNQIGAKYLVTVNINASRSGTKVNRRLQMKVLNFETNATLLQSNTNKDWDLK